MTTTTTELPENTQHARRSTLDRVPQSHFIFIDESTERTVPIYTIKPGSSGVEAAASLGLRSVSPRKTTAADRLAAVAALEIPDFGVWLML